MHLGAPEIALILVIVLIIFGVGKLPQVGSALGKGIREFQKAKDGEDERENSQKTSSSEAHSTKPG